MPTPKPLPHREVFEKLGETQTRFEFAGRPDEIGRSADAWLAEKEAMRAEDAAAKRDAREEETLRIAKDALASANEANRIASRDLAAAERASAAAERQARWAIWAAIIATIAAIVAANDRIIELMSWLQK